jgi:sulfite reductase (ferredoxin)
MLRVRSDGGALDLRQLRAIADVSTTYARDTADISDRQNTQLHWVRIEDVPDIWDRLEAVGLGTTEACGDVPRVVLGSPVAGVAAAEVIDGSSAVAEIVRRFVGNRSLSNLPRKFKSAVSGLPDVAHEINDLTFLGSVHPALGPGFDVWVGGGLSTNPRLAERIGAWVPAAEVPDVWAGVVALFRDHGYRRLRNRARLKFLVADWGVERFRSVLEEQYLGRPLRDGPPPPSLEPVDHVGVHPQRDGCWYVGAAPVAGRVSGRVLAAIADLVESYGGSRVRLTAQQKIVLLDVPEADVPRVTRAVEELPLRVGPSVFRRGVMACTGIEFCKLAVAETKTTATSLVEELERRLPDFDRSLTINVNGCPNACARLQIADIGLKGMVVTTADGRQVEGFQVHLGGSLGQQAGFGRTVRGLKVTTDDLPGYVEGLLRRYQAGRHPDESFARWAVRADEEQLR